MDTSDSGAKVASIKTETEWQGRPQISSQEMKKSYKVQGLAVGNASAFEMDALDTRIRELIAYARERDGEDRTLLFRNLVDLFLTGKAPKKQPTRDQLLDVIEALVPHVEPEGRRTVAELVANMSDPPLDLVCRLAKDRPHLIGDLLRSTAFDEADIIELINCTGRDHHHVIASRNDLSANVWIALARAAPAAPPFDNQSTLALWRDDLGAFGGQADPEIVTPFRDPSAPQPVNTDTRPTESIPDTFVTETVPADDNTPADTSKTAQLRILRTDKDLIADRIEKSTVKLHTGVETSAETSQSADASVSARTAEGKQHTTIPSAASENLEDTANGGWSWRSDRDGLVTHVSPRGYKLLGPGQKLVGGTILDMLGLNTKLGHPVSRAFQRRSTIHDAPLTLDQADDLNRFWTMEARPKFSANGGIFIGYEGIMMPVLASSGTELPLNSFNSQGQTLPPLFSDDQNPDAAPALSGQDTLTSEEIDRTQMPPPPSEAELEKTIPAKTDALKKAPTGDAPASNGSAEHLQAIATDLIKDMISESVTKMLGGQQTRQGKSETSATPEMAPQERQERQPTRQEASAPAQPTPARPDRVETTDELAATLHILEQALSTMVISGQTAKNSALRLQTEIATACLKTLKEQIGTAGRFKVDD